MNKELQKRKPGPKVCDICHKETDKQHIFWYPTKHPIYCASCAIEAETFSEMRQRGWLGEDGRIRPAFRRAVKQHALAGPVIAAAKAAAAAYEHKV
jgi:hypothetical protein